MQRSRAGLRPRKASNTASMAEPPCDLDDEGSEQEGSDTVDCKDEMEDGDQEPAK